LGGNNDLEKQANSKQGNNEPGVNADHGASIEMVD
jgi:hypothetical protein